MKKMLYNNKTRPNGASRVHPALVCAKKIRASQDAF